MVAKTCSQQNANILGEREHLFMSVNVYQYAGKSKCEDHACKLLQMLECVSFICVSMYICHHCDDLQCLFI